MKTTQKIRQHLRLISDINRFRFWRSLILRYDHHVFFQENQRHSSCHVLCFLQNIRSLYLVVWRYTMMGVSTANAVMRDNLTKSHTGKTFDDLLTMVESVLPEGSKPTTRIFTKILGDLAQKPEVKYTRGVAVADRNEAYANLITSLGLYTSKRREHDQKTSSQRTAEHRNRKLMEKYAEDLRLRPRKSWGLKSTLIKCLRTKSSQEVLWSSVTMSSWTLVLDTTTHPQFISSHLTKKI